MSKNPARLNDTHHCPKDTPTSHGDGKIITGNSSVLFGYEPVACEGDTVECADGSTTTIQPGNACVMVGGKRLALVDDETDHGGKITSGAGSIHVAEGKPFVFIGANVKIGKNVFFGTAKKVSYDQHFILHHDKTGKPLAHTPYKITTASGQEIAGISDEEGKTQLVSTAAAEEVTIEIIHEFN